MAVPPLSIIVITYNEENYLAATLQSLARQTFRNFEVLIIDSASSDATEPIARAQAPDLPAFRFINLHETLGPGHGRNRGAEAAKFDQLLFLDADVSLEKDFLAKALAEMAKHSTEVATCPLRIMENSLSSRAAALMLNSCMRLTSPFYASAYGACLFSSKQVHAAVHGFDLQLGICEDCYYVKQARQAGHRFRILHVPFSTSNRRAQHNGLKLLGTYVSCHLRRMLTGREIMKKQVQYHYGAF